MLRTVRHNKCEKNLDYNKDQCRLCCVLFRVRSVVLTITGTISFTENNLMSMALINVVS